MLLKQQLARNELYMFCKNRDVTPKRIKRYVNSQIAKYNYEHPAEPYKYTDEEGLDWTAAQERAKMKAPKEPLY